MKDTLLLTFVALLATTGCASQPTVQTRGSLREVAKQGSTYHLDASRSGLGENDVRELRERLRQAGLTPAAADTAQLVVTLSSEVQAATERRHTGGKNGVAYDHPVDGRAPILEVSSADVGASSADKLLKSALATLGN